MDRFRDIREYAKKIECEYSKYKFTDLLIVATIIKKIHFNIVRECDKIDDDCTKLIMFGNISFLANLSILLCKHENYWLEHMSKRSINQIYSNFEKYLDTLLLDVTQNSDLTDKQLQFIVQIYIELSMKCSPKLNHRNKKFKFNEEIVAKIDSFLKQISKDNDCFDNDQLSFIYFKLNKILS